MLCDQLFLIFDRGKDEKCKKRRKKKDELQFEPAKKLATAMVH